MLKLQNLIRVYHTNIIFEKETFATLSHHYLIHKIGRKTLIMIVIMTG